MKTYEICLMIAFGILTIVFAWNSIKTYRQTSHEQDKRQCKAARKKAFVLMMLGLACLLCALYVVFRVSWLFFIVFLLGCMAVASTIGSGLGENINRHGE